MKGNFFFTVLYPDGPQQIMGWDRDTIRKMLITLKSEMKYSGPDAGEKELLQFGIEAFQTVLKYGCPIKDSLHEVARRANNWEGL